MSAANCTLAASTGALPRGRRCHVNVSAAAAAGARVPASTSSYTTTTAAAAAAAAAGTGTRRVLRPLRTRRRCTLTPRHGPPLPRAASGDTASNEKVDAEIADETTEQFMAFDRDAEGRIVNAEGKPFAEMLDPDSWVMKMQAEYEAGPRTPRTLCVTGSSCFFSRAVCRCSPRHSTPFS